MPIPLTETHLFVAASVCLVGSAALSLLGAHWQVVEQAAAVLALLCMVAGLGLSLNHRGGWPLTLPAEVVIASAAGAILWLLLHRHNREPKRGALFFYIIVAGLLIWGIARWPAAQATSAVEPVQQTWLFASRLPLALACGIFVEAGSLALACLVTKGRIGADYDEDAGRSVVLLGHPLLTASLLLMALGGQYTRSVYWSWAISESWQLLVWLFYTMLWCAFVLLGWRGRRIRVLTALGIILTLLMLNALGS